MRANEISTLVYKYKTGTLSDKEEERLNSWIEDNPKNKILFDELKNDEIIKNELEESHPINKENTRKNIWDKIKLQIPELNVPVRSGRNYWKISGIAAGLIVFLGLAVYLFTQKKQASNLTVKSDVEAPKNNRATIILADGQKVALDSVLSGTIALQANYKLIRLEDGQLTYQSSGGVTGSKMIYNTIENPKGSKVVDVLLSDGTRVWLNSGSSITFPVNFLLKDREITFYGEAYFEVAPDKKKPFIVHSGKIDVQVLGTGFNIKAYDNEQNIKITLLEGSIELNSQQSKALLKPGEQAVVTDIITVKNDIDIPNVMAWKNNKFIFNNDTIFEIMKQLERWYNIKTEYKDSVTNEEFVGNISRDVNLLQILDLLSETKAVQFEIRDNTVVVKKYQ